MREGPVFAGFQVSQEGLYEFETIQSSIGAQFLVEVKGRKFTIILRKEQEGGYSAQCIELPGAISQGETQKETLANIREAIEGYLEAFPELQP